MLGEIVSPALGVPQLQVVAHADQNDVVLQAGQLDQTLGHENPPTAVQIKGLHLGEEQSAKDPGFAVGRRCLVQLLRELLKLSLIVDPQTLVLTGSDKKLFRRPELLANTLGKSET